MRLDILAVLADAWAAFRRDRDLLLRVAGPFLFLPAFGLALAVPAPPMPRGGEGPNEAMAMAWADAFSAWASAHGGWYLLAYAMGLFGTGLIYALYLDRTRPDVRGSMRAVGGIFLRFVLAMAAAGLMAGAGLLLWVLPGLYLLGRTMLTGPVLFAERPRGAIAAIGRSFGLSRGAGLATMGLAAFTFLAGWVVSQPFLLLDEGMRGAGAANPVALALVDAGAAAAATLAGLAQALIAVAAYRRLAR